MSLLLYLCSIILISLAATNAALATDNVSGEGQGQRQETPSPAAPTKDSDAQDTGMGEEVNDQGPGDLPPRKGGGWFKHLFHKLSVQKLRYYFVAQNTKNCDLFYGLVEDNPFIGRAAVNFVFPNDCTCHGVAQVTHFPLGGPLAGQSGYIKATCSDGRSIKGRFTTTSLTQGNGSASDSGGNEYQFTFGQTAKQSVEAANVIRRKLNCPDCTADDLELKVQARIIKNHNTGH